MPKFYKRPVVVEAHQFFAGKETPGVFMHQPEDAVIGGRGHGEQRFAQEPYPAIQDGHGDIVRVRPGDWIVREGDRCTAYEPGVFELLYNEVTSAPIPAEITSEPVQVITVRAPVSLHESLLVQAEAAGVSLNRLCVSRLRCDDRAKAARFDQWADALRTADKEELATLVESGKGLPNKEARQLLAWAVEASAKLSRYTIPLNKLLNLNGCCHEDSVVDKITQLVAENTMLKLQARNADLVVAE